MKADNQFAVDAIHPLEHVIHAAQHQVQIEDHQLDDAIRRRLCLVGVVSSPNCSPKKMF